jgi:hypothetical protein
MYTPEEQRKIDEADAALQEIRFHAAFLQAVTNYDRKIRRMNYVVGTMALGSGFVVGWRMFDAFAAHHWAEALLHLAACLNIYAAGVLLRQNHAPVEAAAKIRHHLEELNRPPKREPLQ